MKLDLKIPDRWEEGIDHREEAEKLVRLIGAVDFQYYSDSLYLKFGGDGDNGETLTMIISDLIDNGLIEVKIKNES